MTHPDPAANVAPDRVSSAELPDLRLRPGARVAVAMSGGVDSSVVAGLLAEAGFDVVGLTARLYDVDPTEVPRAGSCCAPEDARDARAVAASMGIRHYVLDERRAFHADVVAPFLEAWRVGETPNPCVSCNRSLKFDRLVARAKALGAEALATGHYARLDLDDAGHPRLQRGHDRAKDQAYFLHPLPASTAAYLRFPLGAMSKEQVRAHGERLQIPVAQKPESMDICFVGAQKPADWVASRGPIPSGALVDLAGTRLGQHSNLARYTVGQRRGLGLPGGQGVRYVVDKRADGTVVVGAREDLRVATLCMAPYNSVTGRPPQVGDVAAVQVRHRASAVAAEVIAVQAWDADVPGPEGAAPGLAVTVRVTADLMGAARGQSGVLFDGERVLGGGAIVTVTTHRELSQRASEPGAVGAVGAADSASAAGTGATPTPVPRTGHA